MTFRVSGPSAEHIRGLSGPGAMLTGRRTFDVAQGWGGNHDWGPSFRPLTSSSSLQRRNLD